MIVERIENSAIKYLFGSRKASGYLRTDIYMATRP